MIKNMTRKGLAIGATAALTLAGLVGIAAPAQAAEVTLAPSAGTEYRVPLDAAFALDARFDANANSFNDPLTVEVVDADENLSGVTFKRDTGATTAATYSSVTGKWTATLTNPESDTVGYKHEIVLTPESGLTATFSVKVKAGFDYSAGAFGGTVSPEREVFFHKADDYTWNLALTAPKIGDTEFVASVSTTPQLNIAQFADDVELGFASVAAANELAAKTADTAVGGTGNVNFTDGTQASVTTDAVRQTDGSYKFTVDASGPALVAGSYAAQILYKGSGAPADKQVGTRATALVAAAAVEEMKTPALAITADTTATDIRTGTTAVTVKSTAYKAYEDDDDNTPAVAGIAVKVTVELEGDFAEAPSMAASQAA
jgi:hypothetical protein